MRTRIKYMAVSLLLTVSSAQVLADHHEMAETDAVFETFTCNYNSGKGPADLDKAVDFWNAQLETINSPDLANYFAAIVTPIRSNNTADFYWLGVSPNLNAFARGTSAYMESKAGQAADAKFAKMSTCTSNLFFSEPVIVASPPEPGNNDFVLEGYSCTLKKGKTAVNVAAAEAAYIKAAKATNSKANVYRLVPFLANTPADIIYLVGHDNLVEFGSANTSLFASHEGQASNAGFAEVMDCEAGLYAGNTIHAPAAPQ